MRSFPVLLALFIGIPLIEIYLFIKVGGLVGAFNTVMLVIVTAIIGVSLLRAQGFSTMARFQREVATGQLPATTMMEGVALMFGGALLLTPGFLTDAIGFLCLIPYTRQTIISWAMKNMTIKTTGAGGFTASKSTKSSNDPNVIEGEFRRDDQDPWK